MMDDDTAVAIEKYLPYEQYGKDNITALIHRIIDDYTVLLYRIVRL